MKPTADDLTPFQSDGCTMSPDLNFKDCCIEHDRAYHAGGTRLERAEADRIFARCIVARGHSVFLALLYWMGVRLFGGPWYPPILFWKKARWGYGRRKWSPFYDATSE
jgi:hypothetical protein